MTKRKAILLIKQFQVWIGFLETGKGFAAQYEINGFVYVSR